MRTRILGLGFVAAAALTVWACGGSKDSGSGFNNSGTGTAGNTGATAGTAGTGGTAGTSGDNGGTGSLSAGGNGNGNGGNNGGGCQPGAGNYEIPANNCDDDGDGTVDNAGVACDTGLAATGDATAFAKSLGLCQTADSTHWGVVSATYTNGHSKTGPGDGNFDQQHGILGKFGSAVQPREGAMLGVLSSGSGSENDTDNGPYFKGNKDGMQSNDNGDVPAGYPKKAGTCDQATDVHDVINVKLQIKVPMNAQGIQFDFDFWSGEWPEFVCTNFNDAFIAFLSSAAFNGGKADNVSFDSKNNPVSVNNGFFDRCSPANASVACLGAGSSTAPCAGGDAELQGTGFLNSGKYCPLLSPKTSTGGGATGWLTTQAPVQAGETITLEFMIFDTGDPQYDSSVLLDNFQWVPGSGHGGDDAAAAEVKA